MDIILVKDKTKIKNNIDEYEVVQASELKKTIKKYSKEEAQKMNIFFLTNFEYVEINKKLPDDFILGFYLDSFLPVLRFNLFDFICLQEVFSVEEIEGLGLSSDKVETIYDEETLSVSFKENLNFINNLFRYLKDDKFTFINVDEHKKINGCYYPKILSLSKFIENKELLKMFFKKVYAFLKENSEFDETFIKETELTPMNISFGGLDKEIIEKIYNCFGYFYTFKDLVAHV